MDSSQPAPLPVMPRLEGTPLDRALRLLERLGIVAQLRLRQSESVGIILDQMPPPGTPVERSVSVWMEVGCENPIRFLPEIFLEEDTRATDDNDVERPAEMLRRFLFIPQTFLSRLDTTIRAMPRIMAPESSPVSFIPWLLDLIPMEVDSGWSESRMRDVLRDAPRLLSMRGTASGLAEMIELHSGVAVKIVENSWPFRGTCVGLARIGEDPIVSSVPSADSAFTIVLPSTHEVTQEQIESILRLVDIEKPVSLVAALVRPRISKNSSVCNHRIGMDFVLGKSAVGGVVSTLPARLMDRESLSKLDAELIALGKRDNGEPTSIGVG